MKPYQAHQLPLQELDYRLPFIREFHRILLNSVRGQDKKPGEFRVV